MYTGNVIYLCDACHVDVDWFANVYGQWWSTTESLSYAGNVAQFIMFIDPVYRMLHPQAVAELTKSPLLHEKLKGVTEIFWLYITDDNPERSHGYKQGIVTSTPRRKMQRSHVARDIGESPKLATNLQQRRKSLAFDDGRGTPVDDDLWSHHTVSGKLANNTVWLQQFVAEELLSPGEDLLEIQRSMVVRETGKSLVDFVSHSSPAKGIFARNSRIDLATVCEYPIRYITCLIIMTTENLHVLDMPTSR